MCEYKTFPVIYNFTTNVDNALLNMNCSFMLNVHTVNFAKLILISLTTVTFCTQVLISQQSIRVDIMTMNINVNLMFLMCVTHFSFILFIGPSLVSQAGPKFYYKSAGLHKSDDHFGMGKVRFEWPLVCVTRLVVCSIPFKVSHFIIHCLAAESHHRHRVPTSE